MYKMTKIADVIVPELFGAYVSKLTSEKSTLVESGIITQSPELDKLVTQGGKLINMPFWNDLGGESETVSESRSLSVDGIKADNDVAALLIRGKAWGANELSGVLAGSDPMGEIGKKVAKWWVRDEQKMLFSILKGVFASPTMSDHIKNSSTESISSDLILDTKQLLGDAADQLTAIAMHSAVFTKLQKLNLIVNIPDSRGEVMIPTYLTYRVIVNDNMPVDNGAYTTYLFASGVIARGTGVPASLTDVEMDRDSLASADYLINRQAKVLHPFGIMFTSASVTDETPTNADLEKGENWKRVYESKQIGIVKLIHKI